MNNIQLLGFGLIGPGVILSSLLFLSILSAATSSVLNDRSSSNCPTGSQTLGTTFYEARVVDLQDLDTARVVSPNVVDISPSGDHILVGDFAEYDVKIFDKSGALRSVIGVRGESPGNVYSLDGAAFRNDSSIYIADAGRMHLMEFDLTGALVRETPLPLRPITSVQVVDTTVLIAGRSWPIRDQNDVWGIHLMDDSGNLRARFGRQPLTSVASVPGALAATAPYAALMGSDSVVVAWRLTNQIAIIDLVTNTSRHFAIDGAVGYVDPDTVLRELEGEDQLYILNRASPVVELRSVGPLILLGYFSPAIGSDKLRYVLYQQSGEFVEWIDGAPLVRGVYGDSLLVIGRGETGGESDGYSLRLFALCTS